MMSGPVKEAQRRIHPGAGRRGGRGLPKGRQVEPEALDDIPALLGQRPRQRDPLIEFLPLIQDRAGCLHAPPPAALARAMELALVAVYECAGFYAPFGSVL